MLHVCTPANRHLYVRQLADMDRNRRALFGAGASDEDDDAGAVHLLGVDEDGYCFASVRMRPANGRSAIIERLAEPASADAAARLGTANLWDVSGWINAGGGWATEREMRIGLIEYLLSQGASHGLAVSNMTGLAHMIRTGWRVQPLGYTRRTFDPALTMVVALPISADAAAQARQLAGREDAILLEVDPTEPWVHLPIQTIGAAFANLASQAANASDLRTHAARHLCASGLPSGSTPSGLQRSEAWP
jgi:N-acyl-L-homoserine lactone synthetase